VPPSRLRDRRVVRPDDTHLVCLAHRPALRLDDDVLGIVETGVVEEPLGHAEHLLQRAPQLRPDPAGDLGREPGSADLQHPQRRRALDLTGCARLEPALRDGRHDCGDGDALGAHGREGPVRLR
jgi:hypothetical protein